MFERFRITLLALMAGTMLPLAGCVAGAGEGSSDTGTAAGGGGENPDTQDGENAGSGATRTLQAGPLTVKLPSSWRPLSEGNGRWHVLTEGECNETGYLTSDFCEGFWILGAEDIAQGNERGPFKPDRPYYPAGDVQPCPRDQKTFQSLPSSPRKQGLAQVGDRKANYREWVISCTSRTGEKAGSFVQRTVYLPVSRLLIVDNWQTPGLLSHLKAATVS